MKLPIPGCLLLAKGMNTSALIVVGPALIKLSGTPRDHRTVKVSQRSAQQVPILARRCHIARTQKIAEYQGDVDSVGK